MTHRLLIASALVALACSSVDDGGANNTGGTPPGTTAGVPGVVVGAAGSTGVTPGGGAASVAGANSGTVTGGAGTTVPGAGAPNAAGNVGVGGSSAGAGQGGAAGGGTAVAGAGGAPVTVTPVTEVWVDPNGSDTNPGTMDLPMKTVCDTSTKTGACYKLCKGSYTCPATGGTIWMKGGTYAITKKIDLGATRPGVAGGIMKLFAVAGSKPVIDASGLDTAEVTKTGIGIHLKASYWHIRGIEVKNAPHNCIKIEGGYNTIEGVVVHNCGNTGITIGQYSGTDMSAGPGSNNTVLNCDSYANVGIDGRGEDADGFGAKEQGGKNNVFKGCRSWNNADDGYDFYGWADPISVQDCWSFENATMKAPGGDGNGFKLGNGAGGHTVTNAISAYNIKTAYTSNGASKLSTCTNCKACSNGSVTGSGDHGISGTVSNLSPCVDLKKGEGARNADGSLPSL
jgi:hypothetical protein